MSFVRTVRVLLAVVVVSGGAGACARSVPDPESARRSRPAVTTTAPVPEDAGAPPADAGAVAPDGAPVDPAAAAADDPLPVGAARPPAQRKPSGRVQATGHIEIPAIGLSHPTYEGVDLAVINHGPSHWPGTAMPGERGNTVFPGHRTTYSRPFWDIDKLAPGNEVIFTTPKGRFTYRVTETLIVDDQDSWIIRPTDKATFTIFACHPKGSARQRYVAKGELVGTPIGDGNAPTTTAPRRPAPRPTTTTTTTTAPPQGGIIPGLPG